MNVIAFDRALLSGAWTETELHTLIGGLSAVSDSCTWEIGTTENGDAQLYVLGPDPIQDCEICVSRIGGRYILEDNTGRLLFEHPSLPLVTRRMAHALRSKRWRLVARIALICCTIRTVIHDKVEPLFIESEEMLVHIAPQLAAFA